MTKEVKAMLKTIQRSGSGVGHIFQKKNGGSINHVYKVFDRTVEALGFNKGIKDRRDKVVFYTLRHTFASWLASNGTPLLVIKELGGWQSLDMVERYTHLVPDEKREAIKNLERKKVLDGNAYEVATS